ncbi:unnamed protein product [Coregonus sp. 'balchen']|nr:unnamed protein product [Coregonus sp. 'balchen']
METPESDQFNPTQEMQCPSVVGRRSVLVKSVAEEFFCLTDETDLGRVSVSTPEVSMRSSSTAGHGKGKWMSVMGAKLPELPVHKKEETSRMLPLKPFSEGYEAAFLRDRMRRLCRRSGPPLSLSSPTESLGDILYRKTKYVFDYTVTDMKDKKPDVSRCGSNLSQCVRPALPLHKGFTISTSRYSQGKPSTSSQPGPDIKIPPVVTRKHSDIIREERKRHYYKDLYQQVEEKRQQKERERRRITTAEQTHNETMQLCTWGMPGSGAPNYHLDSVRRNKFSSTGMIPQDQLRCKGFSGIPFHLHVK